MTPDLYGLRVSKLYVYGCVSVMVALIIFFSKPSNDSKIHF